MKRLLLALLLLLSAAPCAQAAPLVADISTYRIAISTSFTGIRVFIFGVRAAPGDVVVVVRGPKRSFTLWRKERILGMWVNGAQQTFKNVPDFYMLASSHAHFAPENERLLRELHIVPESLIARPNDAEEQATFPEFSDAFFTQQGHRRMYNTALPLSFMGDTLFKAVIPFPDTISGGDYTVEIYLLSDGQLIGMQVLPVHVEKSGFDAVVSAVAHRWPAIYGILAVILALSAGWAASRVFDKV